MTKTGMIGKAMTATVMMNPEITGKVMTRMVMIRMDFIGKPI